MNVLRSPFWIATALIYIVAVMYCIRRKPRPGKPTPRAVLEYEEWVKDQLDQLYRERAERVEAAFAPRVLINHVIDEMRHAFTGWVDLSSDGEIRVADKLFQANDAFQVVARDEFNTDRAVVTGKGNGGVWIQSHGVLYSAFWTGSNWQVEEVQPKKIAAPHE